MILSFLVAFATGACIAAIALHLYHRLRVGSYSKLAENILQQAEAAADLLKRQGDLQLKQRQLEQERELEKKADHERKKLAKEEERLKQREDKLETRFHLTEKKLSEVEKREALLLKRKEELDTQTQRLEEQHRKLIADLERASAMTQEQSRTFLLAKVATEVKNEVAGLTRKIKEQEEEEAEGNASRILATAINRMASHVVADATITTVALPNEEIKGRIIGREGRNIRALEQATGINFIMDDTPGVIVLSGFDPVRKHIAKVALSELILDGRVHPTRIVEVVEKATQSIDKQIRQYGEDAAIRIGAIDLHPELLQLLGKLKFRYSFGQNVLDHSMEVAHILGIMAAELKLDTAMAKRIGLLHDIGKAVTHEVEGSHALIGKKLAENYGESIEVANGIGCHHKEIDPITIIGSLCGAADTISASRPGCRVEAIGQYVKRLQHLEEIAFEFPGVDKAYALQAGREIRIAVLPDMIDDAGALNLSRDVAKKIQQTLTYPGKIKVTVVREKRFTDYAL